MAGIYIHIPFCKQACTYCNFHFSTSLKQKDDLLAALKKEIRLTKPFPGGGMIETVYFGGGTPSMLSTTEIQALLDAIGKSFGITQTAEITLEANPDDINDARLKQWQQAGINRLSLGIQSFAEKELRWMNRAHNASEAISSIDLIQQAGFSNFSVDLIYGSPLLNDEDLIYNANIIFEKNIPHLSCYALTVEPRTVLDKMIHQKKSPGTDPEKQASQFLLMMNLAQQHGYEHYEISNFAKPGMRSKHNSSYWQGKPYYGFGPSAHSFNGENNRRWNIANNALYIQSLAKDCIPFEEELLTETQQLNEYIMTSLRTIEGIDLLLLEEKFGKDAADQLKNNISKYAEKKMLIRNEERFVLTGEGKLFADGIASALFF